VRIHENTGIAEVIVPDFQLSLAIGKEGQNARLAARLTGWRVDIKSETQLAEEESGGGYAEGEWVEGTDGQLMWQPAGGGEAISAAEAGYGTVTAGRSAAPEGITPERDDAVIGVDDTVDTTPPAEDAAIHVDASIADEAADELAADADLDAEDPDVRAEAELEIEEATATTAGDDA
jgi:transcription termination/antitermination protein NusA